MAALLVALEAFKQPQVPAPGTGITAEKVNALIEERIATMFQTPAEIAALDQLIEAKVNARLEHVFTTIATVLGTKVE